MNIDWGFISELEGKGKTVGYHPSDNSGVTIATGFDLKEKDEDFLLSIGIPGDLTEKLKPYCHLTGSEAAAVASNLELSDQEVEVIDLCSKKFYAARVERQYNSRNPKTEFTDLNSKQQTILCSVGFQYGSFSKTPSFIKHAVNDDWDSVIQELKNFGDAFPTRRNKEADYLCK
tara:strand:- start:464 stop:985 length:522 start_codon:yes stop_codon:yes gene_type:complete